LPEATSIRKAGRKVVIYLLDGFTYDLEPLGAEAEQLSSIQSAHIIILHA
jgi:hypothetical protein